MSNSDFESYSSVFSWRYGSEDMREIWSEMNKARILRRIWVALASAENEFSIVSDAELDDIVRHSGDIDLARVAEIEADVHHDLMAQLKAFAEKCPLGGGKIHLGCTSMDILDNCDAMRMRDSLKIIRKGVVAVIKALGSKISEFRKLPVMAWTHLQSAELTTLGYRFSLYADEFMRLLSRLDGFKVYGKGFKGAVGNASSFSALLGAKKYEEMERRALGELNLEAFSVTTQVYPRSQDYEVMTLLASIALAVGKFALDMRLLQSSGISEMREPFSKHQVGSSAMPFKRNPIKLENMSSLARFVASLPAIAWENAVNSALERTLDDSANRRIFLPEGFLAVDEMLLVMARVTDGLTVDEGAVARNVGLFGQFAATEPLLMKLVLRGANRQEMHEAIREDAMKAFAAGEKPKSLQELLQKDGRILKYMSREEIGENLKTLSHLDFAAKRSVETYGRTMEVTA